MKRLLTFLLALLVASPSWAATILPASPFTFTNGTTADATQVNANFNSIITNTNANAAEAGINNSITSLTGLTTPLPITEGGSGQITATLAFDALSPMTTQGDIVYNNGTHDVRLPAGTAGQLLQTAGASANPSWVNPPASSYFINVTQFPYNAACNGSTDDATAIQAAVTAVQGTGVGIFLPAFCKINTALTVSNCLAIFGGGGGGSGLILGTTTMNGINVTGSCPVAFSNFGIKAAGTQSAGAGIAFNSASTNFGSVFTGIIFTNLFDCFQALSGAVDVKISNSMFFNFIHRGVLWANALNAQQSEVSIISNNFRNGPSLSHDLTGTAIEIVSGGGFRIVSNKIQRVNVGVSLNINTTGLPAAGATLDFLITNNSIEGIASFGISATESDTTAVYALQINDNQLNAPQPIVIAAPNSAVWVNGFTIVGNDINVSTAQTFPLINIAGGDHGLVVSNVGVIIPGGSFTTGLQLSSVVTTGKSTANLFNAATGSAFNANGAGAGWSNTAP